MRALRHTTKKRTGPGRHYRLGAEPQEGGTNFALYSRHAEKVFLLLFDGRHFRPTDIIECERSPEDIWHVFVHDVGAGQLYGYKVKGVYNPYIGYRFNVHKLLIDPYAKAITGLPVNKKGMLFGYQAGLKHKDLIMDGRDNTGYVPKSIVIDDGFDWQSDRPPSIPLEELCLYEVHVRGFTVHPSSKAVHAGTYIGLIEKIPYLMELGINAVELLPVHQHYSLIPGRRRCSVDYWGYNTICFFAPELRYGTGKRPGCEVNEFKTMVRELHKAGIEVILDVVYNHTGEGDEYGPTLTFRGIDNPSYYLLSGTESAPAYRYRNDAGCGNVLDCEKPPVLRLVMDSLRYWVKEMHVDGFRFDLAPILARENGRYSKNSAFFRMIDQDPLLAGVKLIAEPWDLSGYHVGGFPRGWSEWNGRFRDTVRRFWRGNQGQVKELAWRLTGSADLYEKDSRSPANSINFITCHDGFTVIDLYSYDRKHNRENGEDNRDGLDANDSWNCGVEGETGDTTIVALRRRMVKNALCTLFLSLGTPMLCGGDEFLRTQQGNNNPWCQDNNITWFDWGLLKTNGDMYRFLSGLIALRKRYPVLYRKPFFSGRDEDGDLIPDILWFDHRLATPDWNDPDLRFLSYQIDGSEVPSGLGNYHLFIMLNADVRGYHVPLPRYETMRWYRIIDTSLDPGEDILPGGNEKELAGQESFESGPRSVSVLVAKERR
ncbi:MAG: glycogen debranching protein GlgX [Spirochaetales bacterium]|nr:glycogen debranching protein GlgX [Spirochaetales bacterium]